MGQSGIFPLTQMAKAQQEMITNSSVLSTSVILSTMLDPDGNNRHTTLTLRSMGNGSFVVSLNSAAAFVVNSDKIHYIVINP